MKVIFFALLLVPLTPVISYSVEVGDEITFFEKKIDSDGVLVENYLHYKVEIYDNFLDSYQIKEESQTNGERFFWIKADNFLSPENVQKYLEICEKGEYPQGQKFSLKIWDKPRVKFVLVPACKVNLGQPGVFPLPTVLSKDWDYFYYIADLPIFGLASLEAITGIHKMEAIITF